MCEQSLGLLRCQQTTVALQKSTLGIKMVVLYCSRTKCVVWYEVVAHMGLCPAAGRFGQALVLLLVVQCFWRVS